MTAAAYSDGATLLEANPETTVRTGFTIGLFVLPGAVALLTAAVYTPVGPQAVT